MTWYQLHQTILQRITPSSTIIIKVTIGMTYFAYSLKKRDTKDRYLIKKLSIKTPTLITALFAQLRFQRLILIQAWPITLRLNNLIKERGPQIQEKGSIEIWMGIKKMVRSLILDLKETLLDILPKGQSKLSWRNT